jgi:hypothetical protein
MQWSLPGWYGREIVAETFVCFVGESEARMVTGEERFAKNKQTIYVIQKGTFSE